MTKIESLMDILHDYRDHTASSFDLRQIALIALNLAEACGERLGVCQVDGRPPVWRDLGGPRA